MKDFFTAEDFSEYISEYAAARDTVAIDMAARANRKLNKLRSESLVVYKYSDSPNWMTNQKTLSEKDEIFFSFDQKATLMFVENISPEKSSAQKICDILNEHLTDQDRKSLAHFCKMLEGIGGLK